MSIEINAPDIGVGEAEIIEIMVQIGDKVDVEQTLIIIEGDKTSMEVPSSQAGVVKEIKVAVGDKIESGQLIMLFETEKKITAVDAIRTSYLEIDKENSENTKREENSFKEVMVSAIGKNQVAVPDIIVNIDDIISIEQYFITTNRNNISMQIPSPVTGIVKEIKIAKSDIVNSSSRVIIFSISSTTAPTAHKMQEKDSPIVMTSTSLSSSPSQFSSTKKSKVLSNNKDEFIKNSAYIHASPLIRRLAREFGVNLLMVNGTGRKGRILYEDVQDYIKDVVKRSEVGATISKNFTGILPWPTVDFSKFGKVEDVELSRIQKISSAYLSRNWVMIPHVTVMDDVDITEVEAFRKQQNTAMEKLNTGIKITPLIFVMQAIARTLEEMPRFNSSISEYSKGLILKKYVNIGIAVDTSHGVVVPVIRNVNKKGIIELSKELMEISKKARINKLTTSDMQGGSFTISSLGGIGTMSFTPIINAPEVAIMGLSRASIKPAWNGSEFIARLILPMSLSFDHRVIDGADGARFIARIIQFMGDIRCFMM